MPGGQIDEESEIDVLKGEIKEELDCDIDLSSLKYIGEYLDIASGRPDRDVSIKLYQGKIIGTPTPSAEIYDIHWIGKKDKNNSKVSLIIKNKIIPDLIKKEILK
jgi:hypothetical protein